MKGRTPGFNYDSKKHIAHFSLYVPKTGGRLRRERTISAASREEAIRLWQNFRDEINGKSSPPAPTPLPAVITFRTFVTALRSVSSSGARRHSSAAHFDPARVALPSLARL